MASFRKNEQRLQSLKVGFSSRIAPARNCACSHVGNSRLLAGLGGNFAAALWFFLINSYLGSTRTPCWPLLATGGCRECSGWRPSPGLGSVERVL